MLSVHDEMSTMPEGINNINIIIIIYYRVLLLLLLQTMSFTFSSILCLYFKDLW